MKHINIVRAILSSIVICINPLMVKSFGQNLPDYAPGSFIVKFTKSAATQKDFRIRVEQARVITGLPAIDSLCSQFAASSFKPYYREIYNPIEYEKLGRDRLFVLKFPAMADMKNIADIFLKDPNIEEAYPNYLFSIDVIPNDPYYSSQWGLPKISAPSAWGVCEGSSSIIIGILDTGVDLDHPDLQSKLTSSGLWRDEVDIDTSNYKSAGYTLDPDEDYTTPDNVPQDRHGHGTHVAGIAAAATNNDTGVAGVAWYPKIMPLRAGFRIHHPTYGWIGLLQSDDWGNILDWARNNSSVDVINMSFGGYSSVNESQIASAYNAGIILVASSGNDNTTTRHYPAAFDDYVIAVGATDQGDHRCDPGDWGTGRGSNGGSWLDVVAPGNYIRSTDYNNTYSYMSGTSMATPHVSGLAGLILSIDPSQTPAQVRKHIENSAQQVGGYYYNPTTGKSDELGHGRINAYYALKYSYVPSPEYPTIQSAIDDALPNSTVLIAAGTYNENLSMKTGVDVKSTTGKPTINGNVTFNSVSSSTLEDFTINGDVSLSSESSSCTLEDLDVDGTITISGSGATLDGIESESSSGTAIDLDESWVDIIDFTSNNGVDIGIYLGENAVMILSNAQIEDADDYAIRAVNSNTAQLSGSDFCFNDLDASRVGGVGMPWYIEDDYSNSFSGALSEVFEGIYEYEWPDDYDMCPFKKVIGGNARGQPAAVGNPVRGISEPTGEKDLLARGMGLILEINKQRIELIRADSSWSPQDFADQYAEAIKIFNQVIANSADGELTRRAMSGILLSYWWLGQPEEVYKYLNTIREGTRYAELRPYVDRKLISYHIRQGDPSKALQLADSLLASPLDGQQRAALLYQIGNIYWRYLNDPSQAAVYFWQQVKDYPDDPLTESALARLASMGEYVPGDAPTEPETVDELALEGYPNPFNPTATIRFGLPEASKVTLVVYDLMGREVVRLAEGHRDAGWQELVWDGRDAKGRAVPTGIYIARLVTSQGAKAIKLVMMK